MESSDLIVNQRRIAYAHTESSDSNIGVLFCGGFKSNMQGLKAIALEQFCIDHNLAFTRFDYNGHGESEGQFVDGDIGSWAQDAIAIFEQIVCTSNPRQIVVIGSSMGAWIATLLVKQYRDKIAGLITLAAAPDFTEELLLPSLDKAKRSALEAGETLYLPSDYDDGSPYPISAKLIENSRAHTVLNKPFTLDAPIRLIHGTKDKDVPYSMSLRLMETIDSHDSSLTLLKNSDHRLSSPAELKVILQTLQTLIEDFK